MQNDSLCMWCGETYEKHDDERAEGAAVPKVPCTMLKSGFAPIPERSSSPIPHRETPVQYLFIDAMKEIINGRKVTRLEWSDPTEYCLLRESWLMIHKPDGKFHAWSIHENDIAADDWVVLPETN